MADQPYGPGFVHPSMLFLSLSTIFAGTLAIWILPVVSSKKSILIILEEVLQ